MSLYPWKIVDENITPAFSFKPSEKNDIKTEIPFKERKIASGKRTPVHRFKWDILKIDDRKMEISSSGVSGTAEFILKSKITM